MRQLLFFILFFNLSNLLAATSPMKKEFLSHLSFVSVAFTEKESSLENDGDEITAPAAAQSGSFSAISLDFRYQFSSTPKRSYFFSGLVPVLNASGAGLFMGSFGINFYFSSLSSMLSLGMNNSEILVIPKWRFYWGGSVGAGYMVYLTSAQKKSDILIDLSLRVGVNYTFKKVWGISGEGSIGNGTGMLTSTLNTKFFIGVSYFL